MAHRSYLTVSGQKGSVYVDDLVGGQGKEMKFDTYFSPYIGGGEFRVNDVEGAETIVNTQESNHTVEMVKTFSDLVREGSNRCWPQRSRLIQSVLDTIATIVRSGARGAIREAYGDTAEFRLIQRPIVGNRSAIAAGA